MKIFQQAKIMGTYIKQKVEHFLIFRNDKIQRSLAGAGTGEGGGGFREREDDKWFWGHMGTLPPNHATPPLKNIGFFLQ